MTASSGATIDLTLTDDDESSSDELSSRRQQQQSKKAVPEKKAKKLPPKSAKSKTKSKSRHSTGSVGRTKVSRLNLSQDDDTTFGPSSSSTFTQSSSSNPLSSTRNPFINKSSSSSSRNNDASQNGSNEDDISQPKRSLSSSNTNITANKSKKRSKSARPSSFSDVINVDENDSSDDDSVDDRPMMQIINAETKDRKSSIQQRKNTQSKDNQVSKSSSKSNRSNKSRVTPSSVDITPKDDRATIPTSIPQSVQTAGTKIPSAASTTPTDTPATKPKAATAASAAPEDDDNDEEESEDHNDDTAQYCAALPSIEFLHNHCWSCKTQLNLPYQNNNKKNGSVSNDSSNDELICCALHEHPVFKVPTCVVCCEKIKDAEITISDGENGDEEETDNTVCCACGVRFSSGNDDDDDEEDECIFFCCDYCPRSMCSKCLAQAHRSTDKVRRIQEDSNGKWKCSSCNPPKFLKKLQTVLKDSVDSMETSSNRRTVDHIVTDLVAAESKKQNLIQRQDDPASMRDEMRRNLQEELDMDDFSESDVDEAVNSWYEDSIEWLQRYDDFISGLQDELESTHGVDIKEVYEHFNIGGYNARNENGQQFDEEQEPDWKYEADREVEKKHLELKNEERQKAAKRRQEKKKESLEQGKEKSKSVYELDLLDQDEIEDLGSTERNDKWEEIYDDWTGDNRVLYDDPDLIALAQAEEDKLLQQHVGTVQVKKKSASSDEKREKKDTVEARRVRRDIRSQLKSRQSARRKAVRRQNQSMRRRRSASTTVNSTETSNIDIVSSSSEKQPTNVQARRKSIQQADQSNDSDGQSGSDAEGDGLKGQRSLSMFKGSSLVLSSDPYISVASDLAKSLKEHQREAVTFLFNACFRDLSGESSTVNGGFILAHSMGLGKSLSTISLLHALLRSSPSKDGKSNNKMINNALLVVPVNTVANWESEWYKWTEPLKNRCRFDNLTDSNEKRVRLKTINKWKERGGILLTSETVFRSIITKEKGIIDKIQPDVLVVDEAHLMLSKDNMTSQSLSKIATPRRILLTGSPIQNNLLEFRRLMNYVKPGLLEDDEKIFKMNYVEPIDKAMAYDASDSLKKRADELLHEIAYKTNPYFQRKDASVLRKDLPPLTQICIHVRPTDLQRCLVSKYSKLRRSSTDKYSNFLKQYAHMQTVSNHPGTLLVSEENENKGALSKTDEKLETLLAEDSDVEDLEHVPTNGSTSDVWWKNEADKFGREKFRDVESGNKVVALLHILAGASKMNEKTVVFSQSLKTLDYISSVLSMPNWKKLLPSLERSFPGDQLGGWKKGVHYIRIDGGVDGGTRGELIKNFEEDDMIQCFLISSRAGGIGVNLVAASRCVIFDSSFNPTVDLQSLFRCYRFGQKKSVYAYRLFTEGSIEERVYNRAVNKTGLASRVIDDADLRRRFSEAEIGMLSKEYDWICCDSCDKWRMLPPGEVDLKTLPEKMYCENLAFYDQRIDWKETKCSFPEKTQAFWVEHYLKPNEKPHDNNTASMAKSPPPSVSSSNQELEELAKADTILQDLLSVKVKDRMIVQRRYCHDVLNTQPKEDDPKKNGAIKNEPSERDNRSKGKKNAKRRLNMEAGKSLGRKKNRTTRGNAASSTGMTMSQQTNVSTSSTETELTL